MRLLITLLVCLWLSNPLLGQLDTVRIAKLRTQLEQYAKEYSQIEKVIDISITGTIQEFAIAFSKVTKLNLVVDPKVNQQVIVNFSETKPRDILLYLCQFYDLNLVFSGSILSLIPYTPPPKKEVPKKLEITYNGYNDRLEMNLDKEPLDLVVGQISRLTKKNVISTKAASNELISGFFGQAPFEEALELMAKRNDLAVIREEENDYYLLTKNPNANKATAATKSSNKANNSKKTGKKRKRQSANYQLVTEKDSTGLLLLSIEAKGGALSEILKDAFTETEQNYFLFSEPNEQITLKLDKIPFEDFLEFILSNTAFSYHKDKAVYLIGEKKSAAFEETEVFQLQHRSVDKISESIPANLKEGIEIKEFIELNSLILSGNPASIKDLLLFIQDIDKPVPVVNIELLIVDVTENQEVDIGFEAGVAEAPVQAGGRVFPELDFTFSSKGINNLLGLLAGNGIVNLGQVSPNFYANLSAVERNGHAKVHSKPRLATINGKEANFSLGETRYYLQERTTLQGNQNPISLQDRSFQSVNADFSIRIIPLVAGDESVTLEIEVTQSDFIGQIQNDAPPPQVNRQFSSNIKIKNKEMIVLGGLDSKGSEESGSGVPFLSRIPVIKWFFSSRRKAKNKSSLLVFVRPTVIF